jgi:hypothetical protein
MTSNTALLLDPSCHHVAVQSLLVLIDICEQDLDYLPGTCSLENVGVRNSRFCDLKTRGRQDTASLLGELRGQRSAGEGLCGVDGRNWWRRWWDGERDAWQGCGLMKYVCDCITL